jgi:hypothetical protein
MNNNCPNASNLKDSLAVVNLLGCFNCHLHRLRLVFCVSVVADVCILSGLGIKVNRFLGKDVEVFPKSREAHSPRPGQVSYLSLQSMFSNALTAYAPL